jgi:hypothetical protein
MMTTPQTTIAMTMIRPSRFDRATAPLARAAMTAPSPGAA